MELCEERGGKIQWMGLSVEEADSTKSLVAAAMRRLARETNLLQSQDGRDAMGARLNVF